MGERDLRILAQDGYFAITKGFTAMKPNQNPVQGGYAPTLGQGPITPPKVVPNQPTSVQPPKK